MFPLVRLAEEHGGIMRMGYPRKPIKKFALAGLALMVTITPVRLTLAQSPEPQKPSPEVQQLKDRVNQLEQTVEELKAELKSLVSTKEKSEVPTAEKVAATADKTAAATATAVTNAPDT